MKHLSLDDIKIPKPDFTDSKLPKTQIVANWLIEWTKHLLEHGMADFGDFIPPKEMLAGYLNVSSATIQNSIRIVKNLGFFCSKQSLGTYIQDFNSKDINKDDIIRGSIAECKIKKIIIDNNIALESQIPTVAKLSRITDISKNTIRMALVNLSHKGYLEKIQLKGNKHSWIYKKEFILTKEELLHGIEEEDFTLTHQLIDKIKAYLKKTYKPGDKIHSNLAFSRMFEVSIKTINDAMKVLSSKKLILPRRGRYGTIYLGISEKKEFITQERKKPALAQNYSYSWQKTLGHLKKHIIENYEIGDKIAPIRELAQILNVSPNTIRRALSDLFINGYLVSKRGKQGGIFIIEKPEVETDSYRWLALNPKAIEFNN